MSGGPLAKAGQALPTVCPPPGLEGGRGCTAGLLMALGHPRKHRLGLRRHIGAVRRPREKLVSGS